MKSYALCPVSSSKINERVARINAVFTILLLIVSGLTQSVIPVYFLAIDFLLRSSVYSKYSPVGVSSRAIVKYLGLNEYKINAGPKIFAARMGFILSSLVIISLLFNAILPALAVAGILGLFSLLEASLGICIACEIYPFVYRFLYKVNYQ